MMRVFRTSSHPFIKNYEIPEMELLSIAQHHGLKTRLLDWTRSALSALFFACERNFEIDGCVYVLPSTKGIPFIDGPSIKDKSPYNIKEDSFFLPYQASNRITSQQSLFLFFKNPLEPFNNESLIKLIIPANQIKLEIKKDLHLIGINRSVLFPDLDGLSEYLNWYYFKRI